MDDPKKLVTEIVEWYNRSGRFTKTFKLIEHIHDHGEGYGTIEVRFGEYIKAPLERHIPHLINRVDWTGNGTTKEDAIKKAYVFLLESILEFSLIKINEVAATYSVLKRRR